MTAPLKYPKGQDLLWIASDAKGRLAAFLTGGEGPIPSVLLAENFHIYSVEEQISDLPVLSSHKLLVSVPRPDDFISLAERGFFVYDWRDLHRSSRRATHQYEMVSEPTKPLLIGELQGELRAVAGLVILERADFADGAALEIEALVACSIDEG